MIPLENIEHLDRVGLLEAWSALFGRPAPKGLSQSMLRRFLAFEVQARRHGGLSKKTLTALNRTKGQPGKAAAPKLRPSGRLLREWNGVTHVVEVTERGFEWRGKTWRSLSAIAREITGARWSGPRFFGLKQVPKL